MHIPINRPVVLTLTSNNVIHSFWVPELAGKKDVVPGHPNTLTIEAEHARHVHRSVRGVLRPLARQHAPARDRPDPVRLRRVGRPAEDAARAAKVAEFTKDISAKWGCLSCHSVTNLTSRRRRDDRAEPHARRRSRGVRRRHLPDDLDNLTKWVYDAPGRKPAGPLKGWMPNFSRRRHDDAAGAADRQVPAVRYRDRSHSRIRSAADMTTVEDAERARCIRRSSGASSIARARRRACGAGSRPSTTRRSRSCTARPRCSSSSSAASRRC